MCERFHIQTEGGFYATNQRDDFIRRGNESSRIGEKIKIEGHRIRLMFRAALHTTIKTSL